MESEVSIDEVKSYKVKSLVAEARPGHYVPDRGETRVEMDAQLR